MIVGNNAKNYHNRRSMLEFTMSSLFSILSSGKILADSKLNYWLFDETDVYAKLKFEFIISSTIRKLNGQLEFFPIPLFDFYTFQHYNLFTTALV